MMRRLVPPHVERLASSGARHQKASGAALIIDAEGSTALSARLQPFGTEGAEVLADILAAVFTPMVAHVVSQGGIVAEIAGDGILGLFLGDPDEAVSRAISAAAGVMNDLGDLSEFETPNGPASLSVRAVVGAGQVEWQIWSAEDSEAPQNAAFVTMGSAVDEARLGEALTSGGVISVGPSAADHLASKVATTSLRDGFRSVSPAGVRGTPSSVGLTESLSALTSSLDFYPEEIAVADMRGEFRDVVAAFVELEATDSGERGSDMEVVLDALINYRGYLNNVIKPEANNGRIRILALWGAPISREHDIGYALRFIDEVRASVGQDKIRAGVTRSTSFTGFIGSALQEVYTALGPEINLAARICSLADWGEIRVDQNIAARLDDPWGFESLGGLDYRGFSAPITTFRIDYVPPIRQAEPVDGELIGRAGELDRLEDMFALLWEGRSPGTIAVIGDPGIGKSRLARALEGRLSERTPPPVWIRAQADEIRTQPLATLRDALAVYFGRPGQEESGKRLDEYLERIVDVTTGGDYELARTRSALGDLLDLPSDVEKAETLDPKARFENLVLAIENLVGAVERTGPVVVSVADGQWLDGGTADVLRRLSSDLDGKRVAILIESRTPDIALPATHRVDVGPLPESDIARLVERILGENPPSNLVSIAVQRSGGNPFFAKQLAAYIRREEIDPDDLLHSFDSEADVPIDMRKILVARLDDLPGGVRRLVQNASVLGRDIDLEILRQIHSGEGDFESKVRGAVAAGIWNRVDDTHVTFSDLLVREAASGMLLHSDARALHDAAASAIGRVAGPSGGRHAELAYHHDRAGNDAIAAEHYLAAGRTAANRYDNHEALVHLDRALHLLSHDDSARRYQTLRLKHDVYELEGNRSLQEEMIVSMEALASVDGEQIPVEILLLRGRLLAALGRYSEAVDLLDRSSEMVARSTIGEQASLKFLQAQLARYEGRIEDARSLADTARELFTAAGDELRLADTDDFAGGLAWESGDFQAAADLHRSAADTFSAAGRVSEETRALNNLGTAIFSIGDYSEARKIHQAGADRSRAVGYRMGEGDHLDNIGGTAWAVGDLDEAMKFYTDALKIREGMDDAWGVAISKGNLGATLRAMGNPEEGLTLYREALEIDQQIGRRRGEAYDFHGIGLCHLDLGRYNLASESLRRSAEIRDELGEDHLANESHVACAVAMLRRGDTEPAIELVKRVLSDEGDDFFDGAVETTLTRLRCIEVLEASSSATAEALRQRVKEDVLDRANRISDPDDRRSYLEQVESHSQALADT